MACVHENVVPLLNKILKKLGHQSLADVVEALNYLHKVLKEDCPEFVNAASTAIEKGIKKGMEFLQTVIKKAVDVCKQHKELMTHLTKLATKALAREGATLGTKSLMKYGAKTIASQSAKTAFKYSNPAGFAADVAQPVWVRSFRLQKSW